MLIGRNVGDEQKDVPRDDAKTESDGQVDWKMEEIESESEGERGEERGKRERGDGGSVGLLLHTRSSSTITSTLRGSWPGGAFSGIS
jgi:hypothetical protein